MMTNTALIDRFKSLKVMVIGDLMIDAYTWGKVNRISPEAPVPVVNVIKKESRLGGAGNVVLNISSLGAKPYVCSVVGDDLEGDLLTNLLVKNEFSLDGIIRESSRLTTVKERVIAGSQQLLRIDAETDQLISEDSSKALLAYILKILPSMDVVIFEDYDKGVLHADLIQFVIERANSLKIPTVVDPKKRNFFNYSGATLFKPNLHELRDGLPLANTDFDSDHVAKTVADFKLNQNFGGVFVTLSERGVYLDFKEENISISAHIRQIADVSGAGDTVISIAACALAAGATPYQIADLANLGGGLVCEALGVVPIDLESLIKEASNG